MSKPLVCTRMLDMSERRKSPTYQGFWVSEDGSIVGPSGKILSPMLDPEGYQRISVYLGARRWKRVPVHAMVCEAFHGPRPTPKHLVAHGDGNPANNRADNLRWATYAENEADKRAHGRSLIGERHHQAKLTEQQVREIRARHGAGEQQKTLAAEFEVATYAIWSIVHRRTWRHV